MGRKEFIKIMLARVLILVMVLQVPVTVQASTGDISADVVASSREVAKQVEAEGIVLLKNNDNVLPLAAEGGD